MLDCLRRRQKTSVKGGHSFILLHDLGAFFGNAIDRGARLATRGLADDFEDAVETLDLSACFTLVLGKSRLQFFRLRSLGHFWQGFEYLVFCIIDVLECVVEKIFEKFGLLGHGTIPLGFRHPQRSQTR